MIAPINANGSQRQSQIIATQPLQIITQTVPSRSLIRTSPHSYVVAAGTTSFWLNPLPSSSLITINNQTQQSKPELKSTNALRSRPISAGPVNSQGIRRFSKETVTNNLSSKMNVLAKGIATNGTSSEVSMDVQQQKVDSDTYRLVLF